MLQKKRASKSASRSAILQKIIISLVMLATLGATFTVGIISAALALFAFSLLVYYSLHKSQHKKTQH